METRYGTRNIALATWGADTNHHPLGTILASLSLGSGARRNIGIRLTAASQSKRKAPADKPGAFKFREPMRLELPEHHLSAFFAAQD